MIKREQAEKMYEVNAILKMNAEKLDCKVSDLQWKRDKGGNIHVRIKEKQDAMRK